MYKILICFCMMLIIFLYMNYKNTIIYTNTNINHNDVVFCPSDKNNPLCHNIFDDILDNEYKKKNIYDGNNKIKKNKNNRSADGYRDKLNENSKTNILEKEKTGNLGDSTNDKKKTVEEILESLAKQQLYESSYKCEKIKTYNGIKYFEYMDTDPYVDWDDVQKLCKDINGYFFY